MINFKQGLPLILVVFLSGCGGSYHLDDSENSTVFPHYSENSALLPELYWNTSESALDTDGIYSADLDDISSFKKVVEFSDSTDVCISDSQGNLYWSDREKNGIMKSDPDGKNVRQIIFGLDIPIGLAIDESRGRIYWNNWKQSASPQSGEIGYASLEGDSTNIIITEGLASGGHLLFDPNSDTLYISDVFGGKIVKTDIDGNNSITITTAGQPEQLAIDYQNRRLIWADIELDEILSVGLDGLNKQVLIDFNDQFANPRALVIDQNNSKILFVITNNDFYSSNLDGTNMTKFHEVSGGVKSLWFRN